MSVFNTLLSVIFSDIFRFLCSRVKELIHYIPLAHLFTFPEPSTRDKEVREMRTLISAGLLY